MISPKSQSIDVCDIFYKLNWTFYFHNFLVSIDFDGFPLGIVTDRIHFERLLETRNLSFWCFHHSTIEWIEYIIYIRRTCESNLKDSCGKQTHICTVACVMRTTIYIIVKLEFADAVCVNDIICTHIKQNVFWLMAWPMCAWTWFEWALSTHPPTHTHTHTTSTLVCVNSFSFFIYK